MIHPSSYYRHLERELESRLDALKSLSALDFSTPELALTAAAAASGRRDDVRSAIRIALRRGVSGDALHEVLLQTYLFAGYPRAINALVELAAGIGAQIPEPDEVLADAVEDGDELLASLVELVVGEARAEVRSTDRGQRCDRIGHAFVDDHVRVETAHAVTDDVDSFGLAVGEYLLDLLLEAPGSVDH